MELIDNVKRDLVNGNISSNNIFDYLKGLVELVESHHARITEGENLLLEGIALLDEKDALIKSLQKLLLETVGGAGFCPICGKGFGHEQDCQLVALSHIQEGKSNSVHYSTNHICEDCGKPWKLGDPTREIEEPRIKLLCKECF